MNNIDYINKKGYIYINNQNYLNILLLGKSGLGKTSFIDCFENKIY